MTQSASPVPDSVPDTGSSDEPAVGRFVGVGIGTYALPTLPRLPKATGDVVVVGQLLEPVLIGQPLTDPDRS